MRRMQHMFNFTVKIKMKKNSTFFFGVCLAISILTYGQQPIKPNEFKVGIFGANSCKTQIVNGCEVPIETPLNNGYKTSVLNILSEDGFNICQTYMPNEWTSESYLKSYLKLLQANNFKVELGALHYFKPAVDVNNNYLGFGTNVYDNCGNSFGVCQFPYSQNYFRSHTNNFINNIYKISPYKDIIWGYHLSEEASYEHAYNFANNCQGNQWENPNYFKKVEVPPGNVSSAISYFKNSLSSSGITNHKMIVMEANHAKNINANTNDGIGIINPQQYIQLLNKNDKRDVFFEGSYTQFPSSVWINENYSSMFSGGFHYLGSFKSIDYAKNYSSEVHKVINIESTSINSNYLAHYHSNLNIPNANWLWFQAYTSIIHGATGIWFWDLNYSWNSGESKNLNNPSIPYSCDRDFFPVNYQNYISHLAKELRLLSNKNIISTDANTIVATKTDFADPNCIVPAATTYIPTSLPAEKRTENYGLRYTIRSNGTETYMIITNPLNVAVSLTLNFSNSSNQQIQSSIGVNVLFENSQSSVTSSSYKVNRNSIINLTNGNVGSQYYVGYTTNKQLPISFGPMDVKVLKFVSTQPNYDNGWNTTWSNFGSGNINGHKVKDGDLFYTGDFDGDGSEELLCVGYTGGTNDWITVLKYVNDNWEWYWSNNGSSTVGNGIYSYRNNFIVGDFDGDGRDELLGNNINGLTTLFKFNSGNWQSIWSDNGNASHPIRPFKDKFYVGDFNGDGKDELLGCDMPSGWTTTFKWNGSNFIWDWSDNGTNHIIRPYRSNMVPGDFDGDGKDEMLGFDGWSTLFHFDNGNWQWGWSTYGANNFNGWVYPPLISDRILSGNLDSDNKDELFFLQTHSNAEWATTMDLKNNQSSWNWNWSANPQNSVPLIDDWYLAANGGSNTRYYLVKAKSNEPNYLLAMRKFCGNYLVNMYISNSLNNKEASNFENDDKESPNLLNDRTNDIEIFPNPTEGKVQILSSKSDIISILIFDSRGKVIYTDEYSSQNRVEIDLSNHSVGVYFVKLTDSQNSVSMHKIILKK
jgi:hypothetical protein